MSTLTVPPPQRIFDVVMDDGAVIRVRRHGNPAGPRLILSHGNGLAINGYFPYWGLLLADYDVVVFDFRNSGENPVHDGAHSYDRFLKDLTIIYDAIDSGARREAAARDFSFHVVPDQSEIRGGR